MILYCWLAHIIRQLKTKLKNTSNPLVNYLIQLMKWWDGFSKFGQVNKIRLKRYFCPQEVRNSWNCSDNSKKVFDVYISKVYPVVQDEMDFTF